MGHNRDASPQLENGMARESGSRELDPKRVQELLAAVSHDLKSPLSAIMMTAATLARVDAAEQRAPWIRKKAETIQRSAERMAQLIEDLLDYANLHSGRLALDRSTEPPSLIVEQAVAKLQSVAHERGVELHVAIPSGLPPVACDLQRIVHVLSALGAHALKVTPAGGRIAIGVQPSEDAVTFSVRDTGPAIPPDELPHVFERGWRSRDAIHGGAGLALSVAKGVVDAHGGRIWVETAADGSSFSFTLPARAT